MKNVRLNCSLNKENVLKSNKENLLYLLSEIECLNEIKTKNNVFLNLCILIDKSGSMYDEGKLDNVIIALKHVVDNLMSLDNLSLVVFADKAEVIFNSEKVVNKQKLKEKIDKIDDFDLGYQTSLKSGLNEAIKEIHRNKKNGFLNKVIILTDGEVDQPQKCLEIIDKEKTNNIYFTTIGVGNDFNEDFLIDIADKSGARSYYIEKSENIPDIFDKELKSMKSSDLHNVELKVTSEDNVEIRRITKAFPEIASWSQEGVIKFDVISKDQKQSVLLEFVVVPNKTGKRKLVEIELYVNGEFVEKKSVYMNVSEEHVMTKKINPTLTQAIKRVNIHNIQTKALEKVKNGDNITATKMFNNIISTAKMEKDNSEAITDNQRKLVTEALNQLNTTQRLDAIMTKRLMYKMKK